MQRLVAFTLAIATCLAAALFAGGTAAQAAGSAYVADYGANAVSQYSIGANGALAPLTPPRVFATLFPQGATVSPNGKNAYVTDDSGAINQYDVDPSTGALMAKSPPYVFAEQSTFYIAVAPDGKSAYATNANFSGHPPGAGTVSQFNVDSATGALTPKSPPSVPAGTYAMGIAVTPDGRSVFVANSGTPKVSQYDIDPVSGSLSAKTPPTVDAVGVLDGMAVSPDGKSAFAVGLGSNLVNQYDIDRQTGTLSPKNPATVPAGCRPAGIAVTADGRSAYVANSGFCGPGTVSQYDIDPVTGALSPKSPASVTAGTFPYRVAVTADSTSAYVTNLNSDDVSQYDIDPVTGALRPKSPAAVAADSPTGVAVNPPPRAPANKEQCKRDGWRDFPQFKNQGQCVAFAERAK